MKTKFIPFLSFVIILFSACRKEFDVSYSDKTTKRSVIVDPTKFDVLGYGYDVTGEYANFNNVSLSQIINIPKLDSMEPNNIIMQNTNSQEYSEDYAINAKKFSEMISNKVSATFGKGAFSATITANFTSNNGEDAKFIYGTYNNKILKRRIAISNVSTLKNYLTPQFLNDIYNLSPQQIVQKYGTHLLTDIYIGGKFQLIYQAQTSAINREQAALVGLKAGVKSVNVDYTYNGSLQDSSFNYNRILKFKTSGGSPSQALVGEVNFDQTPTKVSLSNWQNSIALENSVLVDFGYNGLLPIYELIDDISIKSQVQQYIYAYLGTKEIQLVYSLEPVYRYTIPKNSRDLMYLTAIHPPSGYSYTNRELMFYAYSVAAPNTQVVYCEKTGNPFPGLGNSTSTNSGTIGVAFYTGTNSFNAKPLILWSYWPVAATKTSAAGTYLSTNNSNSYMANGVAFGNNGHFNSLYVNVSGSL